MKPTASPTTRKPSKGHIAVSGRARTPSKDNPLYLQHVFSVNVRLVRRTMGLSQEELADRASLDRTYISSVERRLRNLSIQNIQRLAVALQVDPRDLLNPGLALDPRFALIR